MCGIAGFIAPLPGDDSPGAERIEAALRSLSHRGPDGRALRRSGRAHFGATRLAIRSPADGVQPVIDETSGVIAVCNGEIDNHRGLRRWLAARGRTVTSAVDVAVIPPLYLELGAEFVSRLEGPFALGLWDPRIDRLLLARDRAGEKSLFFAIREAGIRFASELSALVREDPALLAFDESALAGYLARGFFEAPRTPLAEVGKLAPGEVVTIDASGVARRRYWRIDLVGTPKRRPDPDLFDRVLHQAVERQTDVDADFGVLLSGGLDSSLLAAVARRVRPLRRLAAFTVRFDETSYDEGRAAQCVARTLGLEPVVSHLRADEVPDLLRDLVAHAGEPLADPAWLPLAVLCRRAARDVRMVLSGEGADELFGGYPTYMGPLLADVWQRFPAPLRDLLQRATHALPPSDRKVTVGYLLGRFVKAADLGGLERHRAWLASIPSDVLQRLDAKILRSYLPEPSRVRLLDALQQDDFETALAEALLTKADRGGMRWGLELRAPFLAPGVLAFAATLPTHERIRGLATKVFLKRYATRHLPRSVVYRRKRGLSVPLAAWLRGPLRAWAMEVLGEDRLGVVGISGREATTLLDDHASGRADHARALWTLLVLGEWLGWVGRTRH